MNKNITVRNSRSVDSFLNGAFKHSLLTIEEEVMLVKHFQEGDMEALKRINEANRRFVVSVAKQYQHRGKTLEELIEVGNKGLELAARKFDPRRGFKFISYAAWFIRASILTSLGTTKPDINPSYLATEEKHEIVSKCANEREKEILCRWLDIDSQK